MKTAIVTGASGFVGRYLVSELHMNNIEVTVLKRGELPLKPADVFYHLAWESATGDGRANAIVQMQNVVLTLKMLTAAHSVGCKKFVSLGTVYEKLDLTEKTGNSDFYILAKRYAHESANRLAQKLGIDFVWTTVCHPVGKGIKPAQMLAFAVNGLIKGESPKFGPAESWYDIVAVEDLALGLRLVGEHELLQHGYFIGSGKPRILKDYLIELPQILGVKNQVDIGKKEDDGLRFYKDWFDISPLTKETGYKPKVGFNEAVRNVLR